MNKKKVILLVGIIVIIIAIATFLTIYFSNRAKYIYEIEKVTDINYNIIKENNRYGVIDREGNVLVEPNYDVIQIPNPSKPVFVCMSNYSTETQEYETKVLNDKKEQILTGYETVQAIPAETTADGIPFEKTVLKYKKDGKYGLISIEGKEITKPEYEDISAVKYKEGLLQVKKDGKTGIININGKEVIKAEYDTIAADNYYNINTKYEKTGFIVSKVEEDGYRYGYINYKGEKVLNTEFTEIERVTEIEDDENIYLIAYKDGQAGLLKNAKQILDYSYEEITYNLTNNVFLVQRNGKQGIANIDGKIKIDTKYTNISFGGIYLNVEEEGNKKVIDINGNEVTDGYIYKMMTQDGTHSIVYGEDEIYKIIDNSGNVVVDNDYTYIEEIADNKYIVANYNNNGIIDLTGKTLIELKYSSIFELENTELLQANISSTNSISLINKNMETIATMDEAGVEVEESYIRLYSKTGSRYFDYTGKELSVNQVFPNNAIYAKQEDGKWGFVDKDGNVKVEIDYDMVTELNEYGFAGIRKDDKWGVINEEGEIVQEPQYELDIVSPTFIGKYFKTSEWYGNSYYTTEVQAEETE